MRQTISALCVLSLLAAFTVAARADEPPHAIPAPALDNPLAAGDAQTATLAGGCYWGMQELFEHVKGVTRVVAGFSGTAKKADGMGGAKPAPAEAVQITFDPEKISYGQLLHIYFSAAHDPTQRDRQTPDVGAEYRSNIFYADDQQQKIAEAYIAQLTKAKAYASDIATLVTPLQLFNAVPEGQQDFYLKHPDLPYIVQVDGPKMAAFKTLFPDRYVTKPAKH
jgi:peptide-methionine (S)-S-oxide reductase